MLSDRLIEIVFLKLKDTYPVKDEQPKVKTETQIFRSLVSCLLSAQSRDQNTVKATKQLFELAQSPAEILSLTNTILIEAISPCGLYNVKARNLQKLCKSLIEDHDSCVPNTAEELISLPGIGRKCTDILLRFTFNENVIAVDTHVHRVVNRTGLAEGVTEVKTAISLSERAPKWALRHGHSWLFGHGQQLCHARRPECLICPVNTICEKNGL